MTDRYRFSQNQDWSIYTSFLERESTQIVDATTGEGLVNYVNSRPWNTAIPEQQAQVEARNVPSLASPTKAAQLPPILPKLTVPETYLSLGDQKPASFTPNGYAQGSNSLAYGVLQSPRKLYNNSNNSITTTLTIETLVISKLRHMNAV